MKHCKKCQKTKDESEFSKNSKKKDGLQAYCKECNKKTNKKFRDKNPQYWSYETGYFSDRSKWSYIKELQSANKDIKIYMVKLPMGSYIGSTKRTLRMRMYMHINTVKGLKKGLKSYKKKALPFYYYLKDWTDEQIEDAFRQPIILQQCEGDISKQFKLEKEWITKYIKKGENLLNYHWVAKYK